MVPKIGGQAPLRAAELLHVDATGQIDENDVFTSLIIVLMKFFGAEQKKTALYTDQVTLELTRRRLLSDRRQVKTSGLRFLSEPLRLKRQSPRMKVELQS